MAGWVKVGLAFVAGLVVAGLIAGALLQSRQLNKTPATAATARLQEAWSAYYAAIDEVRANFEASPTFAIDDAHRAGAYHLLQAIIAGNVNGLMGGGDGRYPHIRLVLSPTMRLGVDNPDTYYRGATVSNPDGKSVYRVWGNRGSASDFLLEQFYGPDPQGAISVFEAKSLVTEANGDFELFLSKEPMGQNWMELKQDERQLLLMFRDSFTDWENEQPSTLNIERIGEAGVPSADLVESQLVEQVKAATAVLLRQGQFWPDFSNRLRLIGQNNFSAFRTTGSLGITSQYFAPGFFSLRADEALIVRIDDVEAGYCGFQLTNFWAASPDWPNRQSSLSWCNDGSQAHQSADGSYTFVVAAKDPGVQNWIDTSGNTQGMLYVRIQAPEVELAAAPVPATQLVDVAEVLASVPQDMPRFDADARAQQLRRRQEHARRRYDAW